MTPQEEVNQVKKVLDLNRERWSLRDMLFNPAFTNDFFDMAELKNFGFYYELNEVESEHGNVLKSTLIGPTKKKLSLGSILVSGKDTTIQEDLTTFENLETFIKNDLNQLASQQVTLNQQ